MQVANNPASGQHKFDRKISKINEYTEKLSTTNRK